MINLEMIGYNNVTIWLNGSHHDKFQSKLSPHVDVLLSVYLSIVAIFGFLLNILVLCTMAHRKSKLTTIEVYIINLSLVDLLHTVLAHPLAIYSGFRHRWPLGERGCMIYAATVFFVGICSISTLATMSVMRYIKVCRPTLDTHITIPAAVTTLIPIYINSLIWSISPVIGWGEYDVEPYGLTCTLNWFKPSFSYIICIFVFVYIVPLGTMMTSYCYIYRAVKNANEKVNAKSQLQKYIARICTAMCICFMIAWTPYAVVALVYTFAPTSNIPLFISVSAPYFAKSSTCYNAIIYFLLVKRFRKEALEMLCDWCCFGNWRSEGMLNRSNTLASDTLEEEAIPMKLSTECNGSQNTGSGSM